MSFTNLVAAWIVATLLPGSCTLGLGKLGNWYDKNGYYKYDIGTCIEFESRRIFGFGVRPVGKIVGLTKDEWGGDAYLVEMEFTKDGDFLYYMDTGKDKGTERVKEVQKHFKWNIENLFRPCLL